MRNCYFNMASFYQSIEEYEKAKDYIYKIIPLTIRFNQPLDRIEVYNRLGQLYSYNKQYDLAMSFFDKSIALADTLKFEVMKLNAYGRMVEMYLGSNKMEKALEVFRAKPEFVDLLKKSGFDYVIDQAYGMAYVYLGKLDSGYYFMKRAENGFETRSSVTNRFWYYMNMNTYYRKKGDSKNALVYSLKAKSVSDGISDLGLRKEVVQNLDSVYQELGDFKSAYLYNRQTQQLTDSLEKLSAEKEVLLLEVEDEKKRGEREAAQAAEATIERHNIQYMGITTAIAAIFILLVVLGVFSVSQSTIKILGFFAFIFLFEFIILLADHQIHHWTHGEPWKILAIKIGLISILLPLHHFLEERVIHYLTSKKILELNKKGLFSSFNQKKVENI
jgi:tetratricopeptide (TPR) repeat protein